MSTLFYKNFSQKSVDILMAVWYYNYRKRKYGGFEDGVLGEILE
jgi:hypothetical protein